MVRKGLKKYLINPSLGMSATVLFLLLYLIIKDIGLSLMVSILYSVLADVILRIFTKTKICGLMFILNLAAFVPSLIAWLFLETSPIPDIFYVTLSEILFVCFLALARLSKTYISAFIGNKQDTIEQVFLGEFFDIARLAQYSLTIHLFLVLLYRMVHTNYEYSGSLNLFFYFLIPIIALVSIIAFEEIKTRRTVSQLRQEEWLPIVGESGEVIGRIARSVSYTMKNKFMHPVVRVALVHDGRIYLQKRPEDSTFAAGTYDHPFEKYMVFDQQIDTTVKNTIASAIGIDNDLSYNFLLKYVYENENTKRLIFLYVCRVRNDEQLSKISQLKGKFWSTKQIDESFVDDELFSECFQLEYEYIKNTVLLADMIAKDVHE